MSIIGIICDYLVSVLCYGTLYALLGYVYAQGKQVGRASTIGHATEAQVTEWSGESRCVATVDVQADGYTVEVYIRPHARQRREAQCCGGAHPPSPRRSFRAFSSNLNKRLRRAGPSWTCRD